MFSYWCWKLRRALSRLNENRLRRVDDTLRFSREKRNSKKEIRKHTSLDHIAGSGGLAINMHRYIPSRDPENPKPNMQYDQICLIVGCRHPNAEAPCGDNNKDPLRAVSEMLCSARHDAVDTKFFIIDSLTQMCNLSK